MTRLLAMMQACVVFGLCFVSASARSFEEHKWRDGIQVWQNSRKGRDIMWGRCNRWFHKLKSCILQETTCAAHLSEGPPDADVEVRLGNLPVFGNHPTFVQWWAARKSDQSYDPFGNPEGATVYDDMFQAYPRYYDPDFNGGNVQVDENGEAVIKFRAPATHLIGKHTRVPHVHVRVCSSGRQFSIILGRRDKVQLTPNGPVAKSECNSEENKLHVVDFQSLRPPLRQQASPEGLVQLVQRGRLAAKKFWEELDLDTLEFSPMFQCLSSRLLYDHIEGDCAESCPEGAILTHGQCVKPAQAMQSFSATWDLQVCGCDERCWSDKRDMTLHNLRLEIADHMDIPLHEVHELDLSFVSGSRPGAASLARMHIRITSPRHTLETGTTLLRSLFYNFERSSEVLKMLVLASWEISASDVGFLRKRIHVGSEDAYAPYYQDLDMFKESASSEETADLDTIGPPKPVYTAAFPFTGFAVGFALCVCVLPLVACFRRAKARDPPLRSLEEPLASVEDPPLFQGCHHMSAFAQTRQRDMVHTSVVQQYLVAVYDRALQ